MLYVMIKLLSYVGASICFIVDYTYITKATHAILKLFYVRTIRRFLLEQIYILCFGDYFVVTDRTSLYCNILN